MSVFRINYGVLSEYFGNGGDVVIPDSVTTIGRGAFADCSRLTSITIPDSVTSIGAGAFAGCHSLTSITIPDSVTSIGDAAFDSCHSLTSITIPDSVTTIGRFAFADCSRLTSITIPDSVTSIEYGAFYWCDGLKSITIPGSVTFINQNAFEGCYRLEVIHTEVRLQMNMFGRDTLAKFTQPIDTNDITKLPDDIKPLAVVFFAEHPADWKEKRSKDIIKYAKTHALKLSSYIESHPALQKLMNDIQNAEKATEKKRSPKKKTSPAAAFFESMGGDLAFRDLNLKSKKLPVVLLKDGQEADVDLLKGVMIAYAAQYRRTKTFEFKRIAAADEMVNCFNQDSFQLAIQTLYHKLGVTNERILPFFVRYANGTLFRELVKQTKGKWFLWNSIDMGYLLNDSRDAMLMASKRNTIGKYAQLRGMTEEEFIDQVFADFGFDANGVKEYDLGTTHVCVTISDDLTLQLTEAETGKIIKRLPTKNTDEIKRAAAADDLADLRKNLKRVVTVKGNRLLSDFLSGRSMDAADWQARYLGNAVLRSIARLLVWQQNETTFVVVGNKLIDRLGNPYALSDEPVRVPHPMDMTQDDVIAWQKYFTSNGLKQLFEQVWEPVYTAEEIKPERYYGAVVPAKYLLYRQKHGINLSIRQYDYGNTAGVTDHFTLEDCTIDYKIIRLDTDEDNFNVSERYAVELGQFGFKTLNRQVNHIIYLLDRVTVLDRIRKDDVSVVVMLTRASLPQVTEYINIATSDNCPNVTAILLEYKNKHYPEAVQDVLSDFVLDW